MSEENFTTEAATSTSSSTSTSTTTITPSLSISSASPSTKIQATIESLSTIITITPSSLLNSPNPAFTLLHGPDISSQISTLLQDSRSGAGDNNLCRWLYDTFQSAEPQLQLIVLRFLPIIAGLYLSRVSQRKPALAGFEAILLALYAHETTSRGGQSITITIPDVCHASIYHDPKDNNMVKNNATELNLAVISPTLEPYGTVRATRRARIVGVALELYYSKISLMPVGSKIEFCEFCELWSGQYHINKNGNDEGNDNKDISESGVGMNKKEGRIHLPWELMQPVLRILGHCLLGPNKKNEELFNAANGACMCLHARSLHDINPKAILATESLLRLSKLALDPKNNIDYTEIPITSVIKL